MSRRLATLLIAVSCSSSNQGGGNSDAMATSSEGISITASNVEEVSTVAGTSPPAGGVFVAVEVELANAGSIAAPLDPALFTIETQAGIAFIASPLTAGYTNACDGTEAVEPGANATCNVVFEINTTLLSKVMYKLPDGTTASAPASLPPITPGVFGIACDDTHPCPSPFQCSPADTGFSSVCLLPSCTGSSDPSCADAYTGSGQISCVTFGSGGLCNITCTGGADQCPGILECANGSDQPVGSGVAGTCDSPLD